jgi:hypothetical protein
MHKTLDDKLADIHARGSASKAFILADAKDADMAFGIRATGRISSGENVRYRTLEEFRGVIRDNVRQGLIDIMLMSVSSSEALTIRERLFDGSAVTPAIRANDTSEVHAGRHANYASKPSRPFATAVIDHAQCGHVSCRPEERGLGANLGLYSITFNNDLEADLRTLETYKAFRIEAEAKGFRHFLEVFDPNSPARPIAGDKLGAFINDLVVRALAGVARAGRPIFLKMVYHGPKFMEELAAYDPHLIPGILGGASGTTYDAFKLLAEARKYGARAALYGRKINDAEHQPTFIQFLRWIADGEAEPEEAVRAYHGCLAKLGIKPRRPLATDMQLTSFKTSYGGSGSTISLPTRPAPGGDRKTGTAGPSAPATPAPLATPVAPVKRGANTARPAPKSHAAVPGEAGPDFAKMSAAQRLEYHRERLRKMFGER